MVLDAAFALDKHGKSMAFLIVVIAPRQNLKTGLFKQAALGHAFVCHEPLTMWSAHEFDTAKEARLDLERLIDGSDILRRRVKLTSRGNIATHGAVPEIELISGARVKFKTRTSGGARGLAAPKLFLDEGFAVQPGQAGALMPIMLAQPDPQVYVGSSACRPESAWLWDIAQRGRAGMDPRMVYVEWCAPPPQEACAAGRECDHARDREGCGCDNEELIRTVHSAITRGRILVQTVVDLRTSMPPEEYGREVMGWHDEPVIVGRAIDPAKWADLADRDSQRVGDVALGVEISPMRDYAAISVYGLRDDELGHGQVVQYQPGTAWLPAAVQTWRTALNPVAVGMGTGTYKAIASDLQQLGITISEQLDEPERGDLVVIGGPDMAAAVGDIVADIRDAAFRYVPSEQLDAAAAAVQIRQTGETVTLSRKDPDADLSPFGSLMVARRAYTLRAHLVIDGDRVPNVW